MKEILKVTFDTNCFIYLVEGCNNEEYNMNLQDIVSKSFNGKVDLAITTVLEEDIGQDSVIERKENILSLLSAIPILGSFSSSKKETEIWNVLFPGKKSQKNNNHYSNMKNDVNHLLRHLHHDRDIFITEDKQVLKKNIELANSFGIKVLNINDSSQFIDNYLKETKPIKKYSNKYCSRGKKGIVEFNYSNNDGNYILGTGVFTFETKWSKASDISIHAYNDNPSINAIALIKFTEFPLDDYIFNKCDFSSRSRTVSLNKDLLILKNINNIYAVIKVIEICDDTRGYKEDRLKFEYKIYEPKIYE
jgi:hypothetical protein